MGRPSHGPIRPGRLTAGGRSSCTEASRPGLSARRPWVGVVALLFAVCGASFAQQVATPSRSGVCSAALAHGGLNLAELGARTARLRYGGAHASPLAADPAAQALAALTQSPVEVSSACLWDKPLVG